MLLLRNKVMESDTFRDVRHVAICTRNPQNVLGLAFYGALEELVVACEYLRNLLHFPTFLKAKKACHILDS